MDGVFRRNHRVSSAPNAPPAKPWIVGAGWDLPLVLLAPLVIIPLALAANANFDTWEIALYVGAFGEGSFSPN